MKRVSPILEVQSSLFSSRAEMPCKNLCLFVSQLRMQHAQAVFRWIYNLDVVRGNYNLTFLAPSDIVVETPPFVNTEPDKVEYVQQSLAPRLRTMKALFDYMSHEHELYTAKHVVEQFLYSSETP
jgi:hypothetical protein